MSGDEAPPAAEELAPALPRIFSSVAHTLVSAEGQRERVVRALALLAELVRYDHGAIVWRPGEGCHHLVVCPELSPAKKAKLRDRVFGLLRLVEDDPSAAPRTDPVAVATARPGESMAVPLIGSGTLASRSRPRSSPHLRPLP